MSVVYGRVHCELFGEPAVAELTDAGWRVPAEPALAATFAVLASPSDFGAADGDPMARALARLAAILHGTYEVTPLPGPPPGTIY